MKKYLDRIAAACGIPDPAEACRVVLAIVEEARGKDEFYQSIVADMRYTLKKLDEAEQSKLEIYRDFISDTRYTLEKLDEINSSYYKEILK